MSRSIWSADPEARSVVGRQEVEKLLEQLQAIRSWGIYIYIYTLSIYLYLFFYIYIYIYIYIYTYIYIYREYTSLLFGLGEGKGGGLILCYRGCKVQALGL